ncbi:MAG: hypothetical protein M3R53_09095 [Candidatus Eremiobacteraeota bacterium]|nr:hypothetical protein [Candidatus Eremiobacteraeota bacterium]
MFVRDVAARVTQVTHLARDVVDFAWRPDGAEIAFASVRRVARVARASNYFEAGDNEYTATSPAAPIHLWSVPAAGGAARRLTSGAWTLPPTDRAGIFTPQFAWTPDGRRVLYTRVATAVPGDDDVSALYELDVASRRSVQPAPSGGQFAYWYPRDGDFLSENELHVVAHGRDVALTRSLDRNVGGSLWLPDGKSLLICASDGARVRAWVVSLAGSRRASTSASATSCAMRTAAARSMRESPRASRATEASRSSRRMRARRASSTICRRSRSGRGG